MNVPPFFVLRLPRYPVTHLIHVIGQTSEAGYARTLLDGLLAIDTTLDAVRLASPSLHQAYTIACSQQLPLPPAVSLALWRYVFRSHTRATPFGLFAGVGLGELSSESTLRLADQSWYRHTQLEAATVGVLRRQLSQSADTTDQTRYQLNSSVYSLGEEYRYSERVFMGSEAGINLTALAKANFLELLVERFVVSHTLTYADIRALFSAYSDHDVAELVRELVLMQFLITEATLSITGPSPLDQLIDCLPVARAAAFAQPMIALQRQIRRGPLPVAEYAPINEQVNTWLEQTGTLAPEDDQVTHLQTDLHLNAQTLTLATTVAAGISQQLTTLQPLLQRPLPGLFTRFTDRFVQRFDQQQVPLLLALDPDAGVGYAGEVPVRPFQQDDFPVISQRGNQPDQWDEVRMRLYRHHLLTTKREVELTEAMMHETREVAGMPTPPVSSYAFGELYHGQSAASGKEPADWRFYARSTMGAAGTMLGRFCQGNAELREAVVAMHAWEQEQHGTDVLAEVAHWPMFPPRSANVVARPSLREAQIGYLDWDRQEVQMSIRLADLSIAVRGEGVNRQVILTDRRTGKRIRPRLSTAYNAQRGDEIYQFLFALQLLDCPTFAWSWGALTELPFLPRLRYRNVIVSRGRWTIRANELPRPLPEWTIEQIRALYGLPRYVLLIENDNELWLDLDFGPAQLMLRQELEKQVSVRLDEWLAETYTPLFSSANQVYTGEIVLPILQPNTRTGMPSGASLEPMKEPSAAISPKRRFTPGSEWLYVKLYCGSSSAELLLTRLLHPLLAEAYGSGWADKSFFVRYADPAFHLRIRFHCCSTGQGLLLARLNELIDGYINNGLVERMELGTYERELERYSPELIEACETYFSADSQLTLTWLTTEPDADDVARYRFAMASVDQLLTDFGMTLLDKRTFSRLLQEAFWKEQGSRKEVKKYLNRLYRDQSSTVFQPDSRYVIWFNERTSATRSVVARVLAHVQAKKEVLVYSRIIHSLVHMTINRLFVEQPRQHELVVYHFLARRYESLYAQQKRT